MTPLTKCQPTQHKIPATRETIVAAAHAEAPTAIITTKTAVAVAGASAMTAEIAARVIPAMTEGIPKAVVMTATGPKNSARKLLVRHVLTHLPS